MFESRRKGWMLLPACLILSACGGGGSGSAGSASTQQNTTSTGTATPAADSATPTPPPTPAPSPAVVDSGSGQTAAATGTGVDFTWTEDATRSYFNGALELPWPHEMGSWRDRNGTAQGTLPYASVAFSDTNLEQVVRWDVTDLVREHGADFLVKRSGGTNASFHSREADDAAKRPRLIVSRPSGLQTYEATADTALNSTTYKPLGATTTLTTTGPMLLRFDAGPDPDITRAVLELTATTAQYGNQTLEVFRPDPRPKPLDPIEGGIGLFADVSVRLQGNAWRSPAANGFRADRMTVNADGSLTVRIPAGTDTGSNAFYSIPAAARRETMFARIVMKVHDDWKGTMGGKFPGLANTGNGDDRATHVCAWGGRLADGTCWSARTNRKPYIAGTPFADSHIAFSPYAYRVNRTTSNGEGPAFSRALPKNRFFVLDQMVKLNSLASDGTPVADGEVAYWLNGELIGRMTGIVFRDNLAPDTLPSEYWLDVYEGGTGYKAADDHTVTFAEVVISAQRLPFDAGALTSLNGS